MPETKRTDLCELKVVQNVNYNIGSYFVEILKLYGQDGC